MTSNKERNELASMHGLTTNNAPLSLRDASRPTTPWKKQPTLIQAPSNARVRNEADRYDFSQRLTMGSSKTQKKNRLSRTNEYGNETAKTMGHFAPNKRQKLDSGSRSAVILAPDNSDDELMIIENHTSTDDLNITDSPFMETMSSVTAAASSSSKAGSSRLVPDGSSTKWMEERYKPVSGAKLTKGGPARGEDPHDAIEDIVELPVRPGTVKDRVTQIENSGKRSIQPGPHIDLKTAGKKLKNGMKPKDTHRKQPSIPGDDLTSSTPFIRPLNKSNDPMPVNTFFIGHRMYPDGENAGDLFMKWGVNGSIAVYERVSSGPPKALAVFYPKEHFASVTYTDDAEKCKNYVIVKFSTCTANGRRKPEHPYTALFKMGDKFAGNLILKFDSEDSDWSSANYGRFVDWLKNTVANSECIRGYSAAKSLWEEAIRSSNLKQAESRKGRSLSARPALTGIKAGPSTTKAVPRPVKRSLPEEDDTSPPVYRSSVQAESSSLDRPRRSARNINTSKKSPAIDADEVILVYPQGVPGAVNITNADLGRLEPGEYLNDTLIEFGLKYWHRELEIVNPELAKQIHVFSSFFYKKLNKKKTEEGYDSVRKWTSKFDLFDKKYIIVPINENMHWYLAIIYEPENILLLPPPLLATPSTRKSMKEAASKLPLPRLNVEPLNAEENADDSIVPKETAAEAIVSSSFAGEGLKNPLSSVDFQGTVMITTDGLTTVKPGVPDNLVLVSEATSVEGVDKEILSSPLSSLLDDMDVDGKVDLSRTSRAVSSEMELEYTCLNAASTTASSDTAREPDSAIPPAQFYAPLNAKDAMNANDLSAESITIEDEPDTSTMATEVSSPKTYIFTMDSLGSRHPQAVKQLSRYLKLEAHDKKQLDEDMTSNAIGKVAPVPFQPNYCDCGIYLLHLARTFMADPTGYCQKILETKQNTANEDRQQIWNDHEVGGIREALTSQILELSVEWKKLRAAKEEAKKESKPDAVTVESSDDDVDIVETKIPSKSKGPTPRKKAARLR